MRNARFFSSSNRRLLPRFLTPKEEQELYQSITSSFRKKLATTSAKTQDFYSSIIEQSLFSVPRANPASASKLQDICGRIDVAVSSNCLADLKKAQNELDMSNAPIKYYNYLIRAYLRLKDMRGAEMVLKNLPLGVLPSARTFTLLIQEYLSTDLDRAYEYMTQMQDMSCKLHRSFDYIVILRLHIKRDDPLAADFAWNDMLQHKDTVKPTMQLYTTYLGYLASKKNFEKASQVVQNLISNMRTNDSAQKTLTPIQYKTLLSLTNQLALNEHPQTARKLADFLLSSTLASATSSSTGGLPEGLLPTLVSAVLPSNVYTNIVNGYMDAEKHMQAIEFYKELKARNDVQLEPQLEDAIQRARQSLQKAPSKQSYHTGIDLANLAPA
ncbi:hypothetical protein VKS41_005915 [Umbelopsis sp. WA50703]|jgi:hypothetical protein